MNIGERLREERTRLGFNQSDFAALAGIAKTSQFNYEKGERSPDAEYLAAIANAGADVLYVVTGQRLPVDPGTITDEELEVLRFFRHIPEGERKTFIRMAHAMFIATTSPGTN